jgi:hypothetical protein
MGMHISFILFNFRPCCMRHYVSALNVVWVCVQNAARARLEMNCEFFVQYRAGTFANRSVVDGGVKYLFLPSGIIPATPNDACMRQNAQTRDNNSFELNVKRSTIVQLHLVKWQKVDHHTTVNQACDTTSFNSGGTRLGPYSRPSHQRHDSPDLRPFHADPFPHGLGRLLEGTLVVVD